MTLYSPGGLNLADTSAPLILAYDDSGTKDVVFAVSASGDLTITPDGGDVSFDANLTVTGDLLVGATPSSSVRLNTETTTQQAQWAVVVGGGPTRGGAQFESYSILELTQADGGLATDGVQINELDWTVPWGITATKRKLAAIEVYIDGAVAGDQGGQFKLDTKADGGVLAAVFQVGNDQIMRFAQPLMAAPGAVGTPGLSFDGNETYGFYIQGTNVSTTIAGTEVLRVGAAGAQWYGNLGFNAAPSPAFGVRLQQALTTDVSQSGITSDCDYSSAATTAMRGLFLRVNSEDAAYVTDDVYGIQIAAPVFGAAHNPTDVYGLYVSPQAGGSGNNYAIYTEGAVASVFGGSLTASDFIGTIGATTPAAGAFTTVIASSAGPHAFGGATLDYAQFRLTGSFTSGGASVRAASLYINATVGGAAGDTATLAGQFFTANITTQTAEESVADIAQLVLDEPNITDNLTGAGVITNASTLLITGAPDEGEANWGIRLVSGATYLGGTLVATGIASGTVTVTASADDTNVAGVNTVFINPGAAVVIGAFVGGVDGQLLHVVILDADQNVTLEHNEGTGNQNIFLHAGADEILDSHHGGWLLVCDGSNWYDTSHAKHV